MQRKPSTPSEGRALGASTAAPIASAIVKASLPALVPAILTAILPAIAAAVLLALIAAASSGCIAPPEGIPTTPATEQDDIPAPESFVFDAERSYALDPPTLLPEGRFRSWRGVYRGEGQVGSVLAWYVQHMPEHGWRIREIDSSGRSASFEKSSESAEIEVARELDGSLGRYVTVVKASVRPIGPEDRSLEETLREVERTAVQPAEVSGREEAAGLEKGTARTSGASATPAISPAATRSGAEEERTRQLEAIDEAEEAYGAPQTSPAGTVRRR